VLSRERANGLLRQLPSQATKLMVSIHWYNRCFGLFNEEQKVIASCTFVSVCTWAQDERLL
jgi:hypothetical protein